MAPAPAPSRGISASTATSSRLRHARQLGGQRTRAQPQASARLCTLNPRKAFLGGADGPQHSQPQPGQPSYIPLCARMAGERQGPWADSPGRKPWRPVTRKRACPLGTTENAHLCYIVPKAATTGRGHTADCEPRTCASRASHRLMSTCPPRSRLQDTAFSRGRKTATGSVSSAGSAGSGGAAQPRSCARHLGSACSSRTLSMGLHRPLQGPVTAAPPGTACLRRPAGHGTRQSSHPTSACTTSGCAACA